MLNRQLIFVLHITLLLFELVSAQSILIQPYLQDAEPNSMTIMWEVNGDGKGFVDYGSTPFDLNLTVQAESQLGDQASQILTAQLSGLTPNQKYYYRIRMQDGQTSYVRHFITVDLQTSERKTEFIAISDMQRDGSNPDVFREIIEDGMIPIIQSQIDSDLSSLDAVLIPGDLVSTGGNYNSWRTTFFEPSDSLSGYVPYYPVPGNHEYFGGGLPNFLKFFHLPENGPNSIVEQAWYKDISNVRIIGLNSNSGAADQDTQLVWLQALLDSTCIDEHIDFVFAELHHPYKSELWLPGESSFTGEVVAMLENFTSSCSKASIHFFGHTHGYSRGQSRDHKHLWVNVATAGGNIDYWGEFANADYDEFNVSQDEYGFVLIESTAGDLPQFTLKRYTRGDEFVPKDNELVDEITVRNNSFPPAKPTGVFPDQDTINPQCITLKSSAFQDYGLVHQATHWQVAEGCDFVDSIVIDRWLQHENWYAEVNTQAGDDLTDLQVEGLLPGKSYCWRVRYRNAYLSWSEWSTSKPFWTDTSAIELSGNLIQNFGAEDGTQFWTGDIESLLSNECNSVPAYSGFSLFGVGGICANEMTQGTAIQTIDVSTFQNSINADTLSLRLSGYMRNFSGSDVPQMHAEFFNDQNVMIGMTSSISNATPNWVREETTAEIPPGVQTIHIVLNGTRNAGSDNDSYFDQLDARLVRRNSCSSCFSQNGSMIDQDGDGFCADLDCFDQDSLSYPGAPESCDLIDNNCDGKTDTEVANWTGQGNGFDWHDGNNWGQGFPPLPCQHVLITMSDSVSISQNPTIRSIAVDSTAGLFIAPGAALTILGDVLVATPTVQIGGQMVNYGDIHVFPTADDTIRLNGHMINHGRIFVHGAGIHQMKVLNGGTLINTSLLDLLD